MLAYGEEQEFEWVPLIVAESHPLAFPALERTTGSSSRLVSSVAASAIAGYAAGITGVLMGHPLDTMKVWLQTNSMGANKFMLAAPTTATGRGSLISAPLSSMRALYSGISGPLVSVGLIQSVNFASYDAIRRFLHRRDRPHSADSDYLHQDSFLNVALAGSLTGGVLAIFTSPLVTVKTRQQVTGQSFRQVVREMMYSSCNSRLTSCYRGFAPHFISESFGRGVYYAAYEYLKRRVATTIHEDHPQKLPVGYRMACAGASGILCWALIFPFDFVRSRAMNQVSSATMAPLSTMDVVKSTYLEHGRSLRGFYRGFTLTVLRAGPVAAAVLPVYDYVLGAFS